MRERAIPGTEQIVPVAKEQYLAMAQVPYFIEFTPAAAVAVGATAISTHVQAARDFVCTEIGFTADPVGVPVGPSRWRVGIRDIQASRNFQPHRWDISAWVGGNFGTSDNPSREMPVPWMFIERATLEVTFENRSVFACFPTLLMSGYLDVQREQYELVMRDVRRASVQARPPL